MNEEAGPTLAERIHMRSIVALFALTLAACSPFGVMEGDEATSAPSPDPEDEADVKGTTTMGTEPAVKLAGEPAPGNFPGSRLFKPETLPAPAVIVLHGSEGGGDPRYQAIAQELANDGFVALALCWFGCAGTPGEKDTIALETIAAAGDHLRHSSDTNGKVGLFGWDRGAEAALVLTSRADVGTFNAVATYATTDVVHSSWSFGGETIESGTAIPFDAYTGALFITHGMTDNVWPLERARQLVVERNRSLLFTLMHFFPNEGHTLSQATNRDMLREEVSGFFDDSLEAP